MELRHWAERILSADTLEEKLFAPDELTDLAPGPAVFWNEPVRPVELRFHKHTRKDRLPKLREHDHPDKRAACLHRFAGHELLAVEMMAYALIAFPEAPRAFRRGVAHTLREEQEHVRLYVERLKGFGVKLGDLPLYRHFWAYVPFLKDPIQYVSVLSLTFEMANLDFAPHYGASFAKHGDEESAALMQRILDDEIGHVAFGCSWLKKLKGPEESTWDAWRAAVPERLPVTRTKGITFLEEHRRRAGVPEEWLAKLQVKEDPAPVVRRPSLEICAP